MNDKQQLAAMGAQYRLTEEQAKGLAERMPQTGTLQILDDEPLCTEIRINGVEACGADIGGLLDRCLPHTTEQQPMCMAKRIEELEAQVRVMVGLLREARPYMDHRGGAGVKGYTQLAKEIDAALAGTLPNHTEQPLAMVPGGAGSRDLFERWFIRDYHPDRQGPYIKDITWVAWQAALAASPSPEGTK